MGLHSGAINTASDFLTLPRFSMTDGYGSLDRFKMITNALPLNAYNITPEDPYLQTTTPNIGFSLPKILVQNIEKLSCFLSEQGKLELEKIGEQRIQIKLKHEINQERSRLNCTMPVEEDDNQRWRWFGMIMVNPQQDALH